MVAETSTMTWEQVEGVANGLGRKFFEADVLNSEGLRLAANSYATFYDGDFSFMLDMRAAAKGPKGLSFRMAAGVLNCLVAQVRREAKAKPAPAGVVQSSALEAQMDGTFTLKVVGDEVTNVTLRLKTMDADQLARYKKPAGSQVLEYLYGPDNETCYRGFAFVTGREVKIWSKFRDNARLDIAAEMLMSADTETLKAAGYEWALVSGRCYICGHKLTVEASICAGIGPVCAAKIG